VDGGSCLPIVTKALWVGALRLMWIVDCMSLLLVVGCWRRVWVAGVGCGLPTCGWGSVGRKKKIIIIIL
jgi:hypothetical protein